MQVQPLARLPLRFGDLGLIHLGGDLLTAAAGFGVSLEGREVEPLMGGNPIGPALGAGRIGQAQAEEDVAAGVHRRHQGFVSHHFSLYAPEKIPYAIKRYQDETHRLYGVLNKQLEYTGYVAGDYSVADMACVGWAKMWERQGQSIDEFPNVKRWLETLLARPAVEKAFKIGAENRSDLSRDTEAQRVLFGQRAR